MLFDFVLVPAVVAARCLRVSKIIALMFGIREDFEFDGIPLRIVQRRQQWEDHLKGKLGEKKNSSVHRFGTSRGGASNMGKDSAMFHTSVRLLTPNKGNQTKGRSRHKHRKSAGRSLTKARFDVSTFDDEN